jgi:glucosamine-6-phosphate deaminase
LNGWPENPDGVISLPTGKTPEYFIKWTKYLLNNWDSPEARKDQRGQRTVPEGEAIAERIHFVQIDEFYPIDPRQHNSFFDYVSKLLYRGIRP